MKLRGKEFDVWCSLFETVQNKKWLCLVSDIVTVMNSEKVLCGSFALCCSYVAGILKSAEEIHFYVLCNENFPNYIEKYIVIREYTLTRLQELNLAFFREQYFRLNFDDERITISFEAIQFPNLPSELVFAESILKKIELSSLAYGIENINKRITYVSNEVPK